MMKVCKNCGIEKELTADNFRYGKGTYRRECLDCINGSRRAEYTTNRDAHLRRSRTYYKNSTEKVLVKKKEFRKTNLELMREREKKDYKLRTEAGYFKEYRKIPKTKTRMNAWNRRKRQEDPKYKLAKNVSRAVHRYLTRIGYAKNGRRFFAHVQYTVEDLRKHLESQWDDWMSWDNYGPIGLNERTWNIDHIYPQSKLPYDSMNHPNFIKCWALDNLRPLDSIENVRKNNKIIDL